MLSPDEEAELAFAFDERLQAAPDRLPLDLLPDPSQPVARSEAAALMLGIAVSFHGNELTWLRTTLSETRLRLRPEDLVELLKKVFQWRIDIRQRVVFAEFMDFGFSADQLRLAAPIDRAYLGQELFGKWRLGERVASGGVAVVYRGVSLLGGSESAIKIPQLGGSSHEHETYAELIREESRILQRVAGDGVPTLIDIQEADFGPVLVMDWIETVSGPGISTELELSEQLRLVARTGRILDRLHRQDLIHGDVKQQNILVDRQQQVWLTDFNITRAAPPNQNSDGPVPGTLAMMSPESLVGVAADAGVSQDVYALGVLLYELIAKEPFATANSVEEALVITILKGGVHASELLITAPPALRLICQSATTRHVDRRFATAADFAETLERYLAGDLDGWAIPPRRRGLIAWQLGTALGLCMTRVRTMQEALPALDGLEPSSRLPRFVRDRLGYAMGVVLAAEEAQNAVQRLGWRLPNPPETKDLMDAFYKLSGLKVENVAVLGPRLQEFEGWFRDLWTAVEQHIALSDAPRVLLATVALQSRFVPRSKTARETWEMLTTQAGIPQELIAAFSTAGRDLTDDEQWRVVLQQLDYDVGKWLRYECRPDH